LVYSTVMTSHKATISRFRFVLWPAQQRAFAVDKRFAFWRRFFSRGCFLSISFTLASVAMGISAGHAESGAQLSYENLVHRIESAGVDAQLRRFKISSEEKSLVILGESHVKPREEAQKELELIKFFKVRFLEGYAGNGKEPWLKENVTLFLAEWILFPILKRVKQLEATTLHKATVQGFYLSPNGSLFYAGCFLGSQTSTGLVLNSMGVENVQQSLKLEFRKSFLARLTELSASAGRVRNELSAENLHFPGDFKNPQPCSRSSVKVNFEVGDLRKWNRKRVCGDLTCGASKDRLPSTRELRMVDNIWH